MCLLCNAASVMLPEAFQRQGERLVIDGSTKFLEAFANASQMWSYAELMEVDPARAQEAARACNAAIDQLNTARSNYEELLRIIKEQGPRAEAVEALANFNYEALAEAAPISTGRGWDAFVANARSGDVYALLYDFVDGVGRLIESLEHERAYFEAGRMPPISDFGRLSLEWQRLVQHGHQSAQVFQSLGLTKPDLSQPVG